MAERLRNENGIARSHPQLRATIAMLPRCLISTKTTQTFDIIMLNEEPDLQLDAEQSSSDPTPLYKVQGKDYFTKLPNELKEFIFAQLNLFHKLNVRLASRYFFEYIPEYTHADNLQVENLKPVIRNLFACFMCCRLRPRVHFIDKSRMGDKGPGKPKAKNRFCIDCGLKEDTDGGPKLSRNTWVRICKEPWIVCQLCGKLGKAHIGHGTMHCEDCWCLVIQPRLEAHANPVMPDAVEVVEQHVIGETWVSNYMTPHDVVQSAIQIGVTASNAFAKHKKWDQKGEEVIIEGDFHAEDKDLVFDQEPQKKKPKLVFGKKREPRLKIPYRQFVTRSRIHNDHITEGPTSSTLDPTEATNSDSHGVSLNTVAPIRSGHSASDAYGVAGPGPSTVANSAKTSKLTPEEGPNIPIWAQKANRNKDPGQQITYKASEHVPEWSKASSPQRHDPEASKPVSKGLERPDAFSSEGMNALVQPRYSIYFDMDLKPPCALKIQLTARSYSTKLAPSPTGDRANSGNIIGMNYLKARKALHQPESDRKLGWHTVVEMKTTWTAVLDGLCVEALARAKRQSTSLKNRKAPDMSSTHETTTGGEVGLVTRKKKRRIEEGSDDEWKGFTDCSRSSSPVPVGYDSDGSFKGFSDSD